MCSTGAYFSFDEDKQWLVFYQNPIGVHGRRSAAGRIVIGSKQTNGAYALIDMLIPPKGGPGPHSHANFQEAFYTIDGEIEVITKEKTYTAAKGSYVNIPFNGPVRKFTNKTDKTARVLCLTTPAGMEK